jgi:hypothetical protein
MSRDAYRTISGVIFGLIALVQGIRIARQLPVQVGSTSIPWGFRGSSSSSLAAFAYGRFEVTVIEPMD